MKVLVTGSSGQLGSYVCESLLDKYDVVGLDLRPCPYPNLRRYGIRGDIRKPSDVKRAMKGVDAVVHCAAQVSVERSLADPIGDAETNVLGTVRLLEGAASAGVDRFVYVSSAAVYGDPKYIPVDEKHPTEPLSNYGASKLSGEKFALAFARTTEMEVSVVRPFNFYSVRADPKSPYSGVITKFVKRVRAGRPPIIEGDGLQTRDFIHAQDVANMILLVLRTADMSGQVMNCGSGVQTSVMDLAKLTISASHKELEPEFTDARKGDIRHSLSDTRKARRLLGFKPKISLRDGIVEMLEAEPDQWLR